MKTNTEGMRYPSIDKLLEKEKSKYKLVYMASQVAAKIDAEKKEPPFINTKCSKSVGVALEEILKDRVKVTFNE